MPQNERTYIAIDLKSYYASVECMERGLDPMQTNLVVADQSRTEKTICLAVSPALKAYGIPGRARLFEVVERVRQVNAERQRRAPGGRLTGKSADNLALKADASLAVDYLVAPPRMAKYIEVSMQIYGIYLKYISPEDIHTLSLIHIFSSMAVNGKSCKPGEAKVTAVAKSGKHPYHLIKTTGSSSTCLLYTSMKLRVMRS